MNIEYPPSELDSPIYRRMKIFIVNKTPSQESNNPMDTPDNEEILNKLSSISNSSLLFNSSSLLIGSSNQISSGEKDMEDIISS
jgi:hypothetical protein